MDAKESITTKLQHLTKEQLQIIAKAHQLNISENSTKEEISESIGNILLDHFKADTEFFLLTDLYFYASIIVNYFQKWYSEEDIDFLQSILNTANYSIQHYDGQMLFDKGYLAVLTDKDNKERIVMHSHLTEYFLDDIKEIVEHCIINEKTIDYLTALSNLYGCFTVEPFLTVWELYSKEERWTKEKMVNFCNRMNERIITCWYNGQYIINPMIKEEELDELLEQTADKPYYTPTENEIKIYTHNLIDKSTKAYQKMTSYFKKHKSGLKPRAIRELTSRLALAFKFNSKPDDIMKILNSMDYKFKNEKDREAFTEMIEFCTNNTRKWIHRGATAEEFSQEQEN